MKDDDDGGGGGDKNDRSKWHWTTRGIRRAADKHSEKREGSNCFFVMFARVFTSSARGGDEGTVGGRGGDDRSSPPSPALVELGT